MNSRKSPSPEPTVSIRRIDGTYRVIVVHEDLEATHRLPRDRSGAWALAARIAAAFAEDRELNLAHWDFEPIDSTRRR